MQFVWCNNVQYIHNIELYDHMMVYNIQWEYTHTVYQDLLINRAEVGGQLCIFGSSLSLNILHKPNLGGLFWVLDIHQLCNSNDQLVIRCCNPISEAKPSGEIQMLLRPLPWIWTPFWCEDPSWYCMRHMWMCVNVGFRFQLVEMSKENPMTSSGTRFHTVTGWVYRSNGCDCKMLSCQRQWQFMPDRGQGACTMNILYHSIMISKDLGYIWKAN